MVDDCLQETKDVWYKKTNEIKVNTSRNYIKRITIHITITVIQRLDTDYRYWTMRDTS